jgi:hypothetical protein
MSKDSVDDWDTDANDNTDVGGNNIAEGCPPSSINNAIRTVMAQIKTWYENVPQLDADNDFTGVNTFTTAPTFSTALAIASGGTGGVTAAAARTALGLGTMAVVNSPVPVANGGTGATTAAGARTALGLGDLAVLGFSDLVYTGTSASNATFPIGTTLAVTGVTPDRSGLDGVFIPASSSKEYREAGPTQLSGVWRGRGAISGGTLMQRTA